ncbi:MAG TPA: MarR family transcriptional regulator [Actinomycetales bacterium]|nr:MarR family transcriptional regulator [Actinomycetales bacterium]
MTDARWLDESEQQVWRAYLAASQQLWDRLDDDLQSGTGMPLSEYEILVRLSEAPDGRLRMSQLADLVVHSRSRLTHTVARMERRGLVVRRPCEEDGRGVLAELTDHGYEVLAKAAPVHVQSVRQHMFDPLTPEEVAVLGRAMRKIAESLKEA